MSFALKACLSVVISYTQHPRAHTSDWKHQPFNFSTLQTGELPTTATKPTQNKPRSRIHHDLHKNGNSQKNTSGIPVVTTVTDRTSCGEICASAAEQTLNVHCFKALIHCRMWPYLWPYWAIQRSWFARVNALCNLSRKKSREVAAHFWADFWVGVASRCV